MLSAEHGKVITDALGEIARGLENIEFACGIPHLLKGSYSEQAATGVDVYSIRQPLGVVAGITPFNFPAMVPMWMFASAIACGNTFILKPSEKDPSAINYTRYIPPMSTEEIKPDVPALRGIERPAIWTNTNFNNKEEVKLMTELIALHSFFSQRTGSITCPANPCITINDQVRIYERTTSDNKTVDTQKDIKKSPVKKLKNETTIIYKVKKGDSIFTIAKKYKTTAKNIKVLNKLNFFNYILYFFKMWDCSIIYLKTYKVICKITCLRNSHKLRRITE